MTSCVYCGGPRQCLDHFPPISQLDNIDVSKFLKKGGQLLLYPACLSCNTILNRKWNVDLLDRMDYVAEYYIKKLDKMEVWEEDEINELGPTLKSTILANQYKIQDYNTKLTNILAQIDKQLDKIHKDEKDT